MKTPFLLYKVPGLKEKVHPISLIKESTPIHSLPSFSRKFKIKEILIKREDQTDSETYGGNKVRNLEYVLGEALFQKCKSVSTLIPYGSNFSAALAAQTKKVGLEAKLSQFVLQKNAQIQSHFEFGLKNGALMQTFENRVLGFPMAVTMDFKNNLDRSNYRIAPGASSVLGALGHANAFLEAVEQCGNAIPDRIVVGAGTCGTIAGLLVGIHLSGKSVKVTGVRCAEKIVCNPYRIKRLFYQVLRFLDVEGGIPDFEIVDGPGRYAESNDDLQKTMTEFFDLEKIYLDSTYTSKVIHTLKAHLHRFESEKILYWHTYSPNAVLSC